MKGFFNTVLDSSKEVLKDIKHDSLEIIGRGLKSRALNNSLEESKIWDHLPYDEYSDGIFKNKNSYGFILKVSHFSGVSEQKKDVLGSFVNYEVPTECYLEIINYASPKIGHITNKYLDASQRGSLYEKLARRRVDYINSGSWKNILGNKGFYIFRDFSLYFVVTVKREEDLEVLKTFKEKMHYTLERLGCSVKIVDDMELAALLKEFLYPEANANAAITFERKDKIMQYMDGESEFVAEVDGVRVTNNKKEFKYLIFEVVEFPDAWELGESVNLMEKFEHGVRMPFPFMIRYGMKFLDHEKSKRMAGRTRALKIKQGDTDGIFQYVPKMIEEIEDWDYIDKCLGTGQRLARGAINILVVVSERDSTAVAQAVKSHFSELKFKIEQVRHETINSMIATLPFGFTEGYQKLEQLKITGTLTSHIAKNLMPIFADHGNTASPLMLLGGRRGQLFYFDNFLSKENFNMVIVGKPGAGKSTFLNELTASTLRLGGQVVTLDDGESAKEACLIQGGIYVDFKQDFCINPFTLFIEKGAMDDYVADFEEPFVNLVMSMLCIIMGVDINGVSPENTVYKTIMRRAIVSVMKKKGEEGGFKDIWIELKENPKCSFKSDPDITNRLIDVLEDYAIGDESCYFNGKSSLSIESMFTVFEFSKLNSNKVIKNSVLMLVTFLVYSKMFKRERRMALIIDEAWSLLKHDGMKEFMASIARRARKYKGCLVVATQNYFDFDKSESQTANEILACSDWRVMAGADRADEVWLKELFSLDMEIGLLKGVETQKGLYSEYMIKHKNGGSDIARLFLEPFSRALYSSTAEDVKRLESLKKEGLSTEQAIEKIIGVN